MKKITLDKFNNNRKNDCLKEAKILRKVEHPNIIRYCSSFVESNCLFIIMEYAAGGDL